MEFLKSYLICGTILEVSGPQNEVDIVNDFVVIDNYSILLVSLQINQLTKC